jgi:hypothetical protein
MASTQFTKTYSSDGNRRTMTFSFWFKRGSGLGANQYLHSIYDTSSGYQADIRLRTTDILRMYSTNTAGTTALDLQTNRKFRDVNAWYHVVFAVDTTQATNTNRLKLWVNGVQETSFDVATYPAQNTDLRWNGNNNADTGGVNYIGSINSGQYFDGSMAHFHFIDGTAYAASDFGETDSTTGIWKPKTSPSVTYGTNGFFLNFENTSDYGEDSSGNNNDWTLGGTMTQTIDTPSNVFATANALIKTSPGTPTFSNGNNTIAPNAAQYQNAFSTLGVSSGKWYWELKVNGTPNSANYMGVSNAAEVDSRQISGNVIGANTSSYSVAGSSGDKRTNDSNSSYGSAFADGDIMMGALDLDNGKVFFGKNGTWFNSGDPASGTNPAFSSISSDDVYFPAATVYNAGFTSMNWNFGNGYFGTTAVSSAGTNAGIGTFEYNVPSGYKALCTKNINAEEYS